VKDRCEDEIQLNWPTRQGASRLKKTAAPDVSRIPRISRLMALAIKFQGMVDRGEVRDYAELAQLGYVTRARLTQIMNLLLLGPDIQEFLLGSVDGCPERSIRRAAAEPFWPNQRAILRSIPLDIGGS
jgi:hypothetical protein